MRKNVPQKLIFFLFRLALFWHEIWLDNSVHLFVLRRWHLMPRKRCCKKCNHLKWERLKRCNHKYWLQNQSLRSIALKNSLRKCKKKSLRPFWMSETCKNIVHFSFTIWRQKKIMKNKRIFWHDKLKINEFNFLGIWNWCELPGEKIHSVNNRKQVCREKNLKKNRREKN